MPKIVAPLSEAKIRRTRANPAKSVNLFDGRGLYLLIKPSGTKLWRLRYQTPDGSRRVLSLGDWPRVGLLEARRLAAEALAGPRTGTAGPPRPADRPGAPGASFRALAEAMLEARRPPIWGREYWETAASRLQKYVFPILGPLPMSRISRAAVKAVLDEIHRRGLSDTLKKVKTQIGYVFQFAIDSGLPDLTDWSRHFQRAYPAPPSKNLACLTKQSDVSRLVKSMEAYREVNTVTALALKFSALTLARPGEVRQAEWREMDLEDRLWRIPAKKMKACQPHLVPLAQPTLALLDELREINRAGSFFVFPGFKTPDRPISENTVLNALRVMGFRKDQMCPHGFRGMGSTILNEKGWNRDWIERQLAHGERNRVRAAYNHTDFLVGRRRMMDWWGGYLEALARDAPWPAPEPEGLVKFEADAFSVFHKQPHGL